MSVEQILVVAVTLLRCVRVHLLTALQIRINRIRMNAEDQPDYVT